MSTDGRWNTIERLFAAALEQAPEARPAFLDRACGTDRALRDELDSLLRSHDEAGTFLSGPTVPPRGEPPATPVLARGDRLGVFEIVAPLGAGGMGAVYRARDTRLDRSVALKVLATSGELAGTGRQRFEREARAVSLLSYPHICTLYDIGQSPSPAGDGTTIDFLVMELLKGKTLDAVLGGSPLPFVTAVRYAIELTDALDCAHREGIVHRDLKPQNIMVTASGIKLLDFGLASVRVPPLADPDEQRGLTHPGLMIGTVQYMAPEQIQGRDIDARADLFSLGLVLHEMLTGRRVFDRPTLVETGHAVLHDDPPPLPEGLPPGLSAIMSHCLEKDRERRFQSARDLMFALTSLALLPGSSASDAVARWRRWAPVGAAAIALVAAGTLLMSAIAPRTSVTTHAPAPFAVDAAPEMQPAWSADGKSVVYVRFDASDRPQIVVRSAGSTAVTPLTAGESEAAHPFWARDGSRVFFGEGTLRSVNVTGGGVSLEFPDAFAGDVSPDGRTFAVWRVTHEDGRRTATLWYGAQAASMRRYDGVPVFPGAGTVPTVVRFSPDGSKILLWLAGDTPGIWLLPFPPAADRPPRRLFSETVGEVNGADWMPGSRHVVISARGALVIGDTQTGRVHPLLTSSAWLCWPAVSPAGDRVLFTEDRSDHDVVELPLSGGPPRVVVASSMNDGSAAWSPDGRRLAYVTDRRGPDEVWTSTGDGHSDQPLLTPSDFPGRAPGRIMSLRYSPDGERLSLVTFTSEPGGAFETRLWVVPSHGGTPRPLLPGDARAVRATWAPDGRSLAIRRADDGSVWAVPVDTAQPPRLILGGPDLHVWHIEWSPTGDLIAGVGWIPPDRSARTLVFAPDGTGLRVLPDLGNVALLWSKDGRTIYGVTDIEGVTTLRAVDIASGRVRTVANYGRRLAIAEPINDSLQFMPTPDGKGFLATVYNNRSDIWMLDGLTAPAARGWRLW